MILECEMKEMGGRLSNCLCVCSLNFGLTHANVFVSRKNVKMAEDATEQNGGKKNEKKCELLQEQVKVIVVWHRNC